MVWNFCKWQFLMHNIISQIGDPDLGSLTSSLPGRTPYGVFVKKLSLRFLNTEWCINRIIKQNVKDWCILFDNSINTPQLNNLRDNFLRKKWSSQLVQICVWKGGLKTTKLWGSVYAQKGGLNLPIS